MRYAGTQIEAETDLVGDINGLLVVLTNDKSMTKPEVGIQNRMILRGKVRKHAFDQEKNARSQKKKRKKTHFRLEKKEDSRKGERKHDKKSKKPRSRPRFKKKASCKIFFFSFIKSHLWA